ncbi:MAG: AMP-binding protein [Gammaproteobacteria bacterium]|nr:MAG: AMP-binding protein [Gammaproteobacteria bacterium]
MKNKLKNTKIIEALQNTNEYHVAILEDGSSVSWAQFISHISSYNSVIQQTFGLEGKKKLAIYFEDSYQFLAAFCAVLISGNRLVIPGNNLKGTCENLGELVDGFIGDFPETALSDINLIRSIPISEISAEKSELYIRELSADEPLLSLFTSGSSGEPKLIEKCLRQLEAEISSHELLWGEGIGDSIIVGSVSHQHIYGLLFRVLLPLLSGRTFYSEVLTYPEELHGVLAGFESSVLVSSPTQLSRLTDLIDWTMLHGKIKAVFSSGAPLERFHSLHARDVFGVGITEVLGSTETGGIAYKSENGSDNISWTAFPHIEITQDEAIGAMQLVSPHLPDRGIYQTTDRIEFCEDGKGFVLKGRTDRIVKIEGKRLSLDEMEAVLSRHEFISTCRIITMSESRQIIAVAAVLSSLGKDFFVDNGKFSLNKELTNNLRGNFENVLMPRKWRYIDALPVNSQGKLEHDKIKALFTDSEKPKLPDVIASDIDGDSVNLQIFVPDNIYYFSGHFPGTSILAGVVQLSWVVHYAQEYFGIKVSSKQLDAIKFQSVITPGKNISLDIKFNRDKSNIAFKYYCLEDQSEEISFSSGRIKLDS